MPIPMIGVCGSIDQEEYRQYITRDYLRCLAEAGSVPLLLSMDMTPYELSVCVRQLDGLLLAGGNDIDPMYYNEAPIVGLGEVNPLRDKAEIALIKAFRDAEKPILGICRGLQILNTALGGTVYQDLPSQFTGVNAAQLISHQQTSPARYASHRVSIKTDSLLYRLTECESLSVNSFHHQAVLKLAPTLSACAYADDGVIEAAEDVSHSFTLGVQWHPERMTADEPAAKRIFDGFISACASNAR